MCVLLTHNSQTWLQTLHGYYQFPRFLAELLIWDRPSMSLLCAQNICLNTLAFLILNSFDCPIILISWTTYKCTSKWAWTNGIKRQIYFGAKHDNPYIVYFRKSHIPWTVCEDPFIKLALGIYCCGQGWEAGCSVMAMLNTNSRKEVTSHSRYTRAMSSEWDRQDHCSHRI